jgi:hypothetical protein
MDSQSLEIGTGDSTLRLTKPEPVTFTVQAAALYSNQTASKVELIVNGFPVAEQSLPNDGTELTIKFTHAIAKSSWAAIRVFPNAHTNPVFITVADKPIRANRHSAEWCLRSLDQCWKSKAHTYRAEERPTAERDYETARQRFRTILREHTPDRSE